MSDLKEIIAANLTRLRQQAGLTQLQLADMLNYSDKAVSKWERGESVPDLRVLIQLAEIYHITVDDIVKEQPEKVVKPKLNLEKKHLLITLLSVGLVWVLRRSRRLFLGMGKKNNHHAGGFGGGMVYRVDSARICFAVCERSAYLAVLHRCGGRADFSGRLVRSA